MHVTSIAQLRIAIAKGPSSATFIPHLTMSKDHVRLLRLQAIGTSPPRSQASDAGIDQSFGIIRQELDALVSKVSIASEFRDELERKGALGCSYHLARNFLFLTACLSCLASG